MRKIVITPELTARFFAKVEVGGVNQCWPYKGLRNKKGYGQIGIGQEMLTATHVALTIAGQARPGNLWALHRCDNPPCCNPKHLYWGTVQDNVKDCVERGGFKARKGRRGTKNSQAKLTESDVIAIRASPLGVVAISRQYGVSHACIANIIKRKTWGHV